MSTTHDYLTTRARALGLVLATGLVVAACGGSDGGDKPSDGEDAGGGGKDDAGGGKGDGGGGGNDAGTPDAGKADSGPSSVDGRDKDAGPLDPIMQGIAPPTLGAGDAGAQGGVAYFDDSAGARLLLRGRDPNGDVKEALIEFFNKDDGGTLSPVEIDFSEDDEDPAGNPIPAQSSFTVPVVPVPNEAGFFVLLEQSATFTEKVNTVRVTVKDSGGRASDPVTVSKSRPPNAPSGSCDPYGFNICAASNVCSASGASFKCESVAAARTALGSRVLSLAPPEVTTVLGTLRLTSFWDPPSGCVSETSPKRRPDGLIKLTLKNDAAKVTLSTDNPGTTITDTVLYTVPKITDDPSACATSTCACNDDAQGGAATRRSKLELTDLKKGDHFVVVDSILPPITEPGGRDFEVTVVVE